MKCKGHFCSNHTTLSFCSLRGTAPLFNYSVCFYTAASALLPLIPDTSPLPKAPRGWGMSPAGSPPGPGCCEQQLGSACWGEREAGCGEGDLTLGFQCCSFRVWALQNVLIFGWVESSCVRCWLMRWKGEGWRGVGASLS